MFLVHFLSTIEYREKSLSFGRSDNDREGGPLFGSSFGFGGFSNKDSQVATL